MIQLQDNDTSTDAITQRLPQFEEKFPRRDCPVLHRIAKDDEINRLLGSTITKLDSSSIEQGVDYDLVLENERGLTIFGLRLYAPRFLPYDPAQFTTPFGVPVNGLALFPLPTADWHWLWDRWHVVMTGDTDDQGWHYATRFEATTWRGRMPFGWARRRVWIRLRGRNSQE